MNKHIFFDNLTANIGAMVSGSKKFFAESTDSLSFEELIRSTELSFAEINSEGTYEIRATSTIAGALDPAFRVEKWLGVDHPSIIYHHGNNERPFDYRKRAKNSFRDIFVKARDKFDANLIAVRTPFHNGNLKEYQQKSYEGHPVRTIENGHVTGSLNTVALRKHILEVLQNSEKIKASINTSPERG